MTQNALVVVPSNLELPAHLRTAEAAQAIAAANAAAAGGIRSGGFPRLSKDGSKFHIIDGDSDIVLMNPPAGPGQPALPMALIRVAIVAANPGKPRIYYKDKKKDGVSVEPTCTSADGVYPDAHVAAPQARSCAECQWSVRGSKISEYSGKPVSACDERKQVAFFPVDPNGGVDTSKAYGYAFTPSEFKEWSAYIGALDDKGISVTAVITNLIFDSSVSHPKLLATFGGFLSAEQWQAVLAREHDADVLTIVAPAKRAGPAQAPALPPPPVQPQLPPPAAPAGPVVQTPPPAVVIPVQAPPVPPSVPGFGAVAAQQPAASAASATLAGTPAPASVAPVAAEPAKRTRRTREQMAADKAAATADPRIAHLSPEQIQVIQSTGGPDGAVGKALLAQFPAPVQAATMQPVAPSQAIPVQPAAQVEPISVAATAQAAPAPAAVAPNAFGGAPVVPTLPPAQSSNGMSLAERLQAALNKPAA